MATEASLSISLHLQPHHHRHRHLSAAPHRHPFLQSPKHKQYNLSLSRSASNSSTPPSLQNPLRTGRFLTNDELQKLELLGNYSYHQELESGLLWIRTMREEEMDLTVTLLSESFAESMMMAGSYVKLLEFLVKNYLIERREMMPHNATLLGVYRENGAEDFELAGTVELTFDGKGANANPSTPTPPKNSPYICNMAVRKPLRRRGIGWHLLRASEDLITKMSSSREVYLHCRIIDEETEALDAQRTSCF
ncbi:GCN5-related N-acetyltransferase 5, chloroplastic isoform X2 [Salvia miltiorrhiza]|uniref:GCN5-related N-acetyltransferase 5, chloroplastic isoform X2 n=1 Tax=Salvia miltiorrhiza TaxID=226208 RepID=UPI0025ABFB69|nr:GCN5-related N-acetyltransferase 5, chloroplastic isoform X2 [Salvia miltiorrhiza]